MNLSDFVSQTLQQIADGVATARRQAGPMIAPELDVGPKESDRVFPTKGDAGPAFLVTFDVAVTTTEKSSASGGGGIQVMSLLTAKGEKASASESSSVSRVRFDVPISFCQASPQSDAYAQDNSHLFR